MKTKLEKQIREIMSESNPESTFRVMAHELWRESDGWWSSNDRFRIARGTLEEIMPAIVGRWEVFKVNYAPRAAIKNLENIGFDSVAMLEVDFLPFVDIEPED